MMTKRIIYIAVGIVFIVGVILALVYGNGFSALAPEKTLNLPDRNDMAPQIQVPFLYDYSTKIVYTTDTTVEKDIYLNDCQNRDGEFNVCGSTCAPDAQTCVAVCALTCEIKK